MIGEVSRMDQWRVKLYHLESNGSWKEMGTGYASFSHLENFSGPSLVVESEIDSTILLRSELSKEDIYERQSGISCYLVPVKFQIVLIFVYF
jgi:hypothetical protein